MQVVGLSVSGLLATEGPISPPRQAVVARPAQPAGSPSVPLPKRWLLCLRASREAPQGQFGGGKRNLLGYVGDGEAQPVIGAGPHRNRNLDRDVDRGDDKGK